jgi:hypothetical protein
MQPTGDDVVTGPILQQLTPFVRLLNIRCSRCDYRAQLQLRALIDEFGAAAPIWLAWRRQAHGCLRRHEAGGCELHAPQVTKLGIEAV